MVVSTEILDDSFLVSLLPFFASFVFILNYGTTFTTTVFSKNDSGGLIHIESCLFEKGHIDHLTMTNLILRKEHLSSYLTHFDEKSEFYRSITFHSRKKIEFSLNSCFTHKNNLDKSFTI